MFIRPIYAEEVNRQVDYVVDEILRDPGFTGLDPIKLWSPENSVGAFLVVGSMSNACVVDNLNDAHAIIVDCIKQTLLPSTTKFYKKPVFPLIAILDVQCGEKVGVKFPWGTVHEY